MRQNLQSENYHKRGIQKTTMTPENVGAQQYL